VCRCGIRQEGISLAGQVAGRVQRAPLQGLLCSQVVYVGEQVTRLVCDREFQKGECVGHKFQVSFLLGRGGGYQAEGQKEIVTENCQG